VLKAYLQAILAGFGSFSSDLLTSLCMAFSVPSLYWCSDQISSRSARRRSVKVCTAPELENSFIGLYTFLEVVIADLKSER
jgi:hypothetical protein